MKINNFYHSKIKLASLLLILICGSFELIHSSNQLPIDTTTYKQYSGEVVDSQSGDPLVFAALNVIGTNIATVCNSEGKFILKVPTSLINQSIQISFIGYQTKNLKINELASLKSTIKLESINVSLAEINVFPKDPNYLIRAVLEKRGENYMNEPLLMTSFYRETIKMGRKYVSLSEAVLNILKQPYMSQRDDNIKLLKARKNADYSKLDTMVFKLMGGPYSTVMLDFAKNPYLVLTDDMFRYYDFSITNVTRVNDKLIYVLDFKEKPNADIPLYSGKLYIDSESLAITSATYNLNVSDKIESAYMFIKKKPVGAEVYPTEASYMVNYREKDGKWFYSYSRGQLNFKVDWKKKLFNTNYFVTFEMATTNWKPTTEKSIKNELRMKSNIIMEDAAAGFTDKEFWGAYNVIEPEQSIETAIKKIQKNLDQIK